MFLQQNPNEERSKAIFQLDDSKWKKTEGDNGTK